MDEHDKPTEPNIPIAARVPPLVGISGGLTPSPASPSLLKYGRAGYEGYARSTGGKTYDGRDMPAWEALEVRIQQAWADAAIAILTEQVA